MRVVRRRLLVFTAVGLMGMVLAACPRPVFAQDEKKDEAPPAADEASVVERRRRLPRKLQSLSLIPPELLWATSPMPSTRQAMRLSSPSRPTKRIRTTRPRKKRLTSIRLRRPKSRWR